MQITAFIYNYLQKWVIFILSITLYHLAAKCCVYFSICLPVVAGNHGKNSVCNQMSSHWFFSACLPLLCCPTMSWGDNQKDSYLLYPQRPEQISPTKQCLAVTEEKTSSWSQSPLAIAPQHQGALISTLNILEIYVLLQQCEDLVVPKPRSASAAALELMKRISSLLHKHPSCKTNWALWHRSVISDQPVSLNTFQHVF